MVPLRENINYEEVVYLYSLRENAALWMNQYLFNASCIHDRIRMFGGKRLNNFLFYVTHSIVPHILPQFLKSQ